jgi:hypothetical protein
MSLYMIDPATGWFEIQQYDDKQSITVANIVEQEWFSRYPWSTQITFDRGSEFIGQGFQIRIKKINTAVPPCYFAFSIHNTKTLCNTLGQCPQNPHRYNN